MIPRKLKTPNIRSQKTFQESLDTRPQLNALTSLRFFACASIIFLHSAWFFFDIDFLKNWQLDEGVAFFFVLSGFILTYVYSDLSGSENIKKFLVNRLGRMVPTHVLLTFVTLIVLPCSCATAGVFLANLLSIQSWIPRREYYFGLNAAAWSISVEIFFSFAFIILIRPWKSGWLGKIASGLIMTMIACVWAHFFTASGAHGFFKFNEEYLLKINPLVRTADFILGMATAKLWMRYRHLISWGRWTATVIETALIAIILFEITQINDLIKTFVPALTHYPALTYWMVHGGCAPIFCIVIFMMALERGYIAKLLTNKFLVWLGEISFSMYMLHFILIQCLNFYLPEFGQINWLITYPVYLAAVILLSYLNFNLIENPLRKLIKTLVFRESSFSISNLSKLFAPYRNASLRTAVLITALTTATSAYVINSQSRFHYAQINVDGGIDFENNFELQKMSMASANDGSKIKLTWRSLKSQTVSRAIELTCVNKQGEMLAQYEHKDMFPLKLNQGQIWQESLYIPANNEKRNKWEKLGLRVLLRTDMQNRHFYAILAPKHERLDWWGTRLLLALNKEHL